MRIEDQDIMKSWPGYFVDDLLVAAFEGGITYWCDKIYPAVDIDSMDDIEYHSDCIARGVDLVLFDSETGEDYLLTLAKFIKGVNMFCEDNDVTIEELHENHDSIDADIIIQYALFDNIIYS